ncbi:unnamed protein product [Anisakis simplex]|uniref:Uncharacterized protein n=1 Tax=Anisakis simplex TaxID=6269 RepID=A0A0M3JG14_ANISI|nr:unnamed protein product [Anisakis simplex]
MNNAVILLVIRANSDSDKIRMIITDWSSSFAVVSRDEYSDSDGSDDDEPIPEPIITHKDDEFEGYIFDFCASNRLTLHNL